MTWNYRIFRHDESRPSLGPGASYYALHEVFYNEDGVPETYAINPDAIGDSIDDLVSSLELMLGDVKKTKTAMKNKKYKKVILETKDFEKGGCYYASLMSFERETEKEIEEAKRKARIKKRSPTSNAKPINLRRKATKPTKKKVRRQHPSIWGKTI